jgi:hypothetical protein
MMGFIEDDKIDVFHLDIALIEALIQYCCCADNDFMSVQQVVPFLLSPGVKYPAMN